MTALFNSEVIVFQNSNKHSRFAELIKPRVGEKECRPLHSNTDEVAMFF